MADEVLTQEQPEQTAAQSAPPPSTPTPSAVSAAPSPDGPSGAGAAAAAPAQPAWFESLRSQGIDLGQDEDQARSTLTNIYRQHQQMQPIIPYANAYQQHAREFAEYLASRQKSPAQAAQPQQPWYSQWWSPPEYNPAWEQLITRDDQGNLVPVKGAPPDVVPKYMAHMQHQREFAQKFWQNPFGTIEEPIRHMIRQEAQAISQSQLAQHRSTLQANQFVADNSSWLYERDQAGNIRQTMAINAMSGQPEAQNVLSAWGQKLNQYISDEFGWQRQQGVYDPDRVMRVAYERVQRDAAAYQLSQQQAAPAGAAQAPPATTREAANQRAMKTTPAPARAVGGNHVATAPAVTDGNFAEYMRGLMAENGVSGKDFFK